MRVVSGKAAGDELLARVSGHVLDGFVHMFHPSRFSFHDHHEVRGLLDGKGEFLKQLFGAVPLGHVVCDDEKAPEAAFLF